MNNQAPLLFSEETKEPESHGLKRLKGWQKLEPSNLEIWGLISQVTVYQNQVDRALKTLKRQRSKEGLFRELKRKRFYIKPSLKKKLKFKELKESEKLRIDVQDLSVSNINNMAE